jgi:hypothetical protein
MGKPVSKKNSKGLSYWRFDKKNNRKILRDKPVPYYSDAYKEYTTYAVQALAIWKNKQPQNIRELLPINFKVNVQFLFFYPTMITKADLSNFYEAPQDVMTAGRDAQGVNSVAPIIYQILDDDNVTIIGSHDGSRWFQDKFNPRTVIRITKYKELYEIQVNSGINK